MTRRRRSEDASDPERQGKLPRALVVAIVLASIALVGFVALAVIIATGRSSSLGEQASPQLISYGTTGRVSTTVTRLERLGGGSPVVVGGPRSGPSIVNFFASWCPACRKELSAVAQLADEHLVRVVGVDTDDDSPGTALSLLKAAGASYPVGIGSASLAEDYGMGGLPTTAFLDARGRVVALALGPIPVAELSSWARELSEGRPLRQ